MQFRDMNANPAPVAHKGYDSLTDEQLIELAMIALNLKRKGVYRIDKSAGALVSFTEHQRRLLECAFSPVSGFVGCFLNDTERHMENVFAFVDKCREFGLTY